MLSIAVCLGFYGFAAAVLAPPVLTRLTASGVAPRLGVAAWLVAMLSVLASWTLAAGMLVAQAVTLWRDPTALVRSCVAVLHAATSGARGVVIQIALFGLAALVAAGLGVGGARLVANLLRARRHTHQHAAVARMVGHRLPDSAAVLLDAPQHLVYCMPGRPATIVVTESAREMLTGAQLAAVLAHERAHLRGHHHAMVALTRALAALLPRMTLFATGAQAVGRLTEMCADDAAARHSDRHTVITALLALGTGAPVPERALAATGGAVTERLFRLLDAPTGLHRLRCRLTFSLLLAALLAAPIAVSAFAATGLAGCGTTLF